jgi:hypothetical protein
MRTSQVRWTDTAQCLEYILDEVKGDDVGYPTPSSFGICEASDLPYLQGTTIGSFDI